MLVVCDFNALEWRVPIALSKDPVGVEELAQARDVHTANQEAFNLPSRLIAKKYLFRTIFRGSGWAFAHDPEFNHVSDDPDYWDEINSKFYNKYKGLDRWHTYLSTFVTAGQPIIGPTGRSWMIEMGPPDRMGVPRIPWNVLTNHPVQGTAADIVSLARVSLSNRLKKAKYNCLPVSTVHDSLIVDSADNHVNNVAKTMYEVAADLPMNFKRMFDYELIIPFPVEVKVGPNLTDMEKLPEKDL